MSAAWYTSITHTFDSIFNHSESQLALKTIQVAIFRNSFTQSSILNADFTKRSRIDRVIQLELLPGLEGKTLTVAYTFCFVNDRRNRYMTQYKIDCKNAGARTLWVHRSYNNLSKTATAYSVNIIPVCPSDIFEIAINYYTQRGLIDLNSVDWLDPKIEKTVDCDVMERHSMLPEENQVDLNKVCELEGMVPQWVDIKQNQVDHSLINFDTINRYFAIERIEYGPIEFKSYKIHLVAVNVGIIPKSVIGVAIVIQRQKEEYIIQANRLGLMMDRGHELHIRNGDRLILYASLHNQ